MYFEFKEKKELDKTCWNSQSPSFIIVNVQRLISFDDVLV